MARSEHREYSNFDHGFEFLGATMLLCHGTRLVDGQSGIHRHTFIPNGRWMMRGYSTRAVACLDCGLLAHYVKEPDLRELETAQR